MEVLCRLSYSGGTRDDSNVVRAGILFAALALILGACSSSPSPKGASSTSHASSPTYPAVARFTSGSDTAELHVAIARTEAQKERGLMRLTTLPEDDGMAFVWDAPTQTAFWMKDTPVPLSIAFVDADGTIVTIRDMPPCAADPCPSYASRSPFVTAIEANRGWFARHGIGVGDRMTLEPAA
jgi:uncharacterized membrane protein (UPF0127 family)